jgi:hypothetical protein
LLSTLRMCTLTLNPMKICISVSPNRSKRCVYLSRNNNKLYFFLLKKLLIMSRLVVCHTP